jgi:hypothetical protein
MLLTTMHVREGREWTVEGMKIYFELLVFLVRCPAFYEDDAQFLYQRREREIVGYIQHRRSY